jgi:hypothetical protein
MRKVVGPSAKAAKGRRVRASIVVEPAVPISH